MLQREEALADFVAVHQADTTEVAQVRTPRFHEPGGRRGG